MAGDINLFLDEEDKSVGEISIMVAEKQSLRKGIALEVSSLSPYLIQGCANIN